MPGRPPFATAAATCLCFWPWLGDRWPGGDESDRRLLLQVLPLPGGQAVAAAGSGGGGIVSIAMRMAGGRRRRAGRGGLLLFSAARGDKTAKLKSLLSHFFLPFPLPFCIFVGIRWMDRAQKKARDDAPDMAGVSFARAATTALITHAYHLK